ncbi:hypothetical protein [Lacipirellula parvula]|uniref:Uncharacterized protein n=1 Tax=Lacipirellula parvula TaxID=2650471 RepID=A0A5K7X2Z7_9BACT|nr:hypothetical protein [Lacipirellula parvula]BBO30715.1 hypothetical protein PLANPX_0327 [Lacipirellula parvula]
MKAVLSTGAVVIGVLLLATSLVWGLVFPASAGWTEEKSLRLRDLKARAHVLSSQNAAASDKPSMHGGENGADKKAEYDKVRAELEALDAELQGKIEAPEAAASILRYSGIAFVIAGALAVYTSKG